MKTKIFTITGILAFVTLTRPIIASESDLTKKFIKHAKPAYIDSSDGCRQSHLKDYKERKSFFEAAIDADDLGAIRVLLGRGANIECLGSSDEPPLHYAIRNRRIGIVQELLNAGADCNAGGIDNERPLHIALQKPVYHILLALLRHRGLRIEEEDVHHNIALHFAASYGGIKSEMVQEIIGRTFEARKINAQNASGDTALIIAIRERKEDFAQALLACEGIDLSLCDTEGYSPLHMAAAIAKPSYLPQELMTALVARADKEAINKQQEHAPHDTALIVAIRARNVKFARTLLEHDRIDLSLCDTAGNSPLHVAAAIDNPRLSKGLMDAFVARADAEVINKQQERVPYDTALRIAIRLRNEAFAQALLMHDKIDLSLCDVDGNSPLHIAAAIVDTPCLSPGLITVLAARADEKAINKQQRCEPHDTALSIAIRFNNIEFVQQILKLDFINLNFRDATGKTPLIVAIEMGREDCVRDLLGHDSINPNIADATTGKTPLIVAIERGREDLVRALLAKDSINPNVADAITSKTPLIVAIEMGREDCIKALLAHTNRPGHTGTEYNTPDIDGNTPAHYAVVAGVPLDLRTALLTKACVNYSKDAVFSSFALSPSLLIATQRAIVSRADLRRPNNCDNTPLHIAVQIRSIADLVQSLIATASGIQAIHTFNVNGQLPCDVSIDEVKKLVNPYLPIRWYFWSKNYFVKWPHAQAPFPVEFATVAAPKQVTLAAAQDGTQVVGQDDAKEAAPQKAKQPAQAGTKAEVKDKKQAEKQAKVKSTTPKQAEQPTAAAGDSAAEAKAKMRARIKAEIRADERDKIQSAGQVLGQAFGGSIGQRFGTAVANRFLPSEEDAPAAQ
jgi:ankyrin repeat protein